MRWFWRILAVTVGLFGIGGLSLAVNSVMNTPSGDLILVGLPSFAVLASGLAVLVYEKSRVAKAVLAVIAGLFIVVIGGGLLLLSQLHYMPGS